jgi:putative ABC transport system permease protein
MRVGFHRELRKQKGWFIAIIVLVAVSSGIYSSFRSSYDSGLESVQSAEEDLRAPDITVTTLPSAAIDLGDVPGVSMVSPSLLTDCYTMVDGGRVRGEVSSVPLGQRVNDYRVLEGKDLTGGDQVVVERHYAQRHSVHPGDTLTLHVGDQALDLQVVGVAFSPEHIYLISREGWIEDDYGIYYVPEGFLGPSVNTYDVLVEPGSSVDQVASGLQDRLDAQGVSGVVQPVTRTFGYKAFREDLGALNTMSVLFSGVLMAVYAFVLYIVLYRLVERKRHETGTLRAMGHSRADIFLYFMSFAGVATVAGLLLSLPVAYGILWWIMNWYAVNLLGIPSAYLVSSLTAAPVIESAVLAGVFSMVGAFVPSYAAASLTPAKALRPYVAERRGRRVMSRSTWSPTKKLAVRDVMGQWAKSLATVLVVAMVLSMGLSFALMMTGMQTGLDQRFSENELWDLRVSFDEPHNTSAVTDLAAIEGVSSAEPFSGIAAEIDQGGDSIIIQLNALPENTTMMDLSLGKGHVAPQEAILSADVALRLHASVGDPVTLHTPIGTFNTTVGGVLDQFSTSEAFVLVDLPASTGALLKVEPGRTHQVVEALQELPYVHSWVRKSELKAGWNYLVAQYYGMVYVMDLVTMSMVFLVVGIFAFISAREREWEFVILKSMGYSFREMMVNGLAGFALLVVLGILMGIPLALQLADLFAGTFESLMTIPPAVLDPVITLTRSGLVLVVALATVAYAWVSTLRRPVAEGVKRVFETM